MRYTLSSCTPLPCTLSPCTALPTAGLALASALPRRRSLRGRPHQVTAVRDLVALRASRSRAATPHLHPRTHEPRASLARTVLLLTHLNPPCAPLLAPGRSPPLGSCSCAHTPTPPVSAPCLLQRLFLPSSRAHPAPVPAHACPASRALAPSRKRTPALAQRPSPAPLAAACSRAARAARPRSAAHPAAACLLWPPLCSTPSRPRVQASLCAHTPAPAGPERQSRAAPPRQPIRRPLGATHSSAAPPERLALPLALLRPRAASPTPAARARHAAPGSACLSRSYAPRLGLAQPRAPAAYAEERSLC
jgi:hypothetical protein